MTSYSFINETRNLVFEENALAASTVIIGDIVAKNCTSAATFISDGSATGGYDVWYEVINTTTDNVCLPAVEFSYLGGSITNNLIQAAQDSKSVFCTVIKPPADESQNTRIILRVLHNEESRFVSPADIPCHTTNPGFKVEVDMC